MELVECLDGIIGLDEVCGRLEWIGWIGFIDGRDGLDICQRWC